MQFRYFVIFQLWTALDAVTNEELNNLPSESHTSLRLSSSAPELGSLERPKRRRYLPWSRRNHTIQYRDSLLPYDSMRSLQIDALTRFIGPVSTVICFGERWCFRADPKLKPSRELYAYFHSLGMKGEKITVPAKSLSDLEEQLSDEADELPNGCFNSLFCGLNPYRRIRE